MNKLLVVCAAFIISVYEGCGYTIVRDYDQEELQAEMAAIDSLSVGSDLIISEINYTYIPPPPRRDALDMMVMPARVQFHIIISNIGNADFSNSFLIMYEYPNHYYAGRTSFAYKVCNKNHESISADSSQYYEINEDYPYRGGTFNFTILSNPIIQKDFIRKLQSQFNGKITVEQSRELRYDNNIVAVNVVEK